MATRTIQLIGTAYSTSGDVSLVVNFNGTEVFNGTVTTTNSEPPAQGSGGSALCTWTVDTDTTGSIPMSIAVSGGTLHFSDLQGNYVGYELAPDYAIIKNVEEVFGDLNNNTSSSDGKDNVVITGASGDAPARDLTGAGVGLEGDWTYSIEDGATLACDFSIDASLTKLSIPDPEAH